MLPQTNTCEQCYRIFTVLNSQQSEARRSESEGVEVGQEATVVGAHCFLVVVLGVVEVRNHDRLQPLEYVCARSVLKNTNIKRYITRKQTFERDNVCAYFRKFVDEDVFQMCVLQVHVAVTVSNGDPQHEREEDELPENLTDHRA